MKTVTVQEGGFVGLDQFADLIDISRVKYYSLRRKKDGTLTLKFYDKKRKLVKPKKLDIK